MFPLRIETLEAESARLREALFLALRVIDPEQHDVIEEIGMTLYGDLDEALDPGNSAGAAPVDA